MPAQITTVIFDIGNVLIRWDPRHLYRRLGYSDGASDEVRAETGIDALNVEFDRGLPIAAGLAALVARFPHHRDFILAWDSRWTDMVDGAIEPTVATLRTLKANGVPVYGLTNFSRTKYDVARRMFPFFDEMDDVVVSADHGLIKPDPALYRVLLDRHRLEPSRTVFIDDSAKNIAAAAGLGLSTVHVTGPDLAVAPRLKALGLPV